MVFQMCCFVDRQIKSCEYVSFYASFEQYFSYTGGGQPNLWLWIPNQYQPCYASNFKPLWDLQWKTNDQLQHAPSARTYKPYALAFELIVLGVRGCMSL